jgi:hypothetical protein
MQLQINWWAVLVSAFIGFLVPAIWFAPKLFGNTWMNLSHLSPEETKNGQASTLALGALCSLGLSFAIAGFLNYLGSETFLQGALAGLEFWLGFSFTNLLVDYRFAKRPWKLTFINAGHSAISMTLMGGILATWK